MEHWAPEFEHSSITAENRESFNTAMQKYGSEDDAVVGGFEAMKMVGKPFKLPESMDSMPDDAKADFTTQAHNLLGIRRTKDIKELADVNLKDGMPEGSPYNEEFANSFKQYVIDENLNVNDMPKYAKFFNVAMAKFAEDQKEKTEAANIEAAKKCEEVVIAHPDIGSKEKYLELTELFVRAMKNNVGLKADEVEELADGLALSKLTTNPVLARVMLKQFAPLAAEGSTETGAGEGATAKQTQTPYEWKKARWPKSESMWGKPEDTWDSQGIPIRKKAGIKQ